MRKKFYSTIEVITIVDDDNYETYDDVKRAAILKAQEISSKIPEAKLISVEAANGYLTTKIY